VRPRQRRHRSLGAARPPTWALGETPSFRPREGIRAEPACRPATRGLRGRPVPAVGGALSVARRSLAHSVSADVGALRAAPSRAPAALGRMLAAGTKAGASRRAPGSGWKEKPAALIQDDQEFCPLFGSGTDGGPWGVGIFSWPYRRGWTFLRWVGLAPCGSRRSDSRPVSVFRLLGRVASDGRRTLDLTVGRAWRRLTCSHTARAGGNGRGVDRVGRCSGRLAIGKCPLWGRACVWDDRL
jgi:hypothetical protein